MKLILTSEMRAEIAKFASYLKNIVNTTPPNSTSALAWRQFVAIDTLLRTHDEVQSAFDAEGADLVEVTKESVREAIRGLVNYAEGSTAHAYEGIVQELETALISAQQGLRLNPDTCDEEIVKAIDRAEMALKRLADFRQKYEKETPCAAPK